MTIVKKCDTKKHAQSYFSLKADFMFFVNQTLSVLKHYKCPWPEFIDKFLDTLTCVLVLKMIYPSTGKHQYMHEGFCDEDKIIKEREKYHKGGCYSKCTFNCF